MDNLFSLGCFTRQDLTVAVGPQSEADALIKAWLKAGYIDRVRTDLYALLSLNSGYPAASLHHIACAVAPDAFLTHYAALDALGGGDHARQALTVATKLEFDCFGYLGAVFRRVAPKRFSDLVESDNLRATSPEQSLLDCVEDIETIGDVEELALAVASAPKLDEDRLLRILDEKRNGFVWRRAGCLFEWMNGWLGLSEGFFEHCRKQVAHRSKKRLFAQNCSYPQKLQKGWGLHAPDFAAICGEIPARPETERSLSGKASPNCQ